MVWSDMVCGTVWDGVVLCGRVGDTVCFGGKISHGNRTLKSSWARSKSGIKLNFPDS